MVKKGVFRETSRFIAKDYYIHNGKSIQVFCQKYNFKDGKNSCQGIAKIFEDEQRFFARVTTKR